MLWVLNYQVPKISRIDQFTGKLCQNQSSISPGIIGKGGGSAALNIFTGTIIIAVFTATQLLNSHHKVGFYNRSKNEV